MSSESLKAYTTVCTIIYSFFVSVSLTVNSSLWSYFVVKYEMVHSSHTHTHTQTTSVRCKSVLVLPGPFLMFHLSSTHAHAHKSTRTIVDFTLESCKTFQRAIYDQSNYEWTL